MIKDNDFIVLGAGMVGLTASLLLANQGFSVALVDKTTPKTTWATDSHDLRTVALNPSAIKALRIIGAWQQLRRSDVGLMQRMHVWDPNGGGQIDFSASDNNEPALSYVIENRTLVKTLWQLAQQHPRIHTLTDATPVALDIDDHGVTLSLDNNTAIHAQLILGSDGRHSWLRQTLNISYQQRDYQQHAIATIVETEQPHNNCAYQAFLATGPIGLLPLHHPHRMSVVWSTDPRDKQRLLDLDEGAFNIAISNALSMKLGFCQRIGQAAAFPLLEQHCSSYIQPRAALLGDAAHAIHPLAGQGANLGIADATALTKIFAAALEKKQALGDPRLLRRYQRQRHDTNTHMILLMQTFKTVFCDQANWVIHARNAGLNTANRSKLLKQCFMRYAS